MNAQTEGRRMNRRMIFYAIAGMGLGIAVLIGAVMLGASGAAGGAPATPTGPSAPPDC